MGIWIVCVYTNELWNEDQYSTILVKLKTIQEQFLIVQSDK